MLRSISRLSSNKHAAPYTRADIFGVRFLLFIPGATEPTALMCNCIRNSKIRIRNCHQLNYLFLSHSHERYRIPPACSQPNEPTLSIAKFYFICSALFPFCARTITQLHGCETVNTHQLFNILLFFLFSVVVSGFQVPTNTETQNESEKKKLFSVYYNQSNRH